MGHDGMRLLLVDDHAMVCQGLRALLEPPHSVVGMAYHGDDALGLIERTHPDVVLLDLTLPGQGGLAILRALRSRGPAPAVVVVTAHEPEVYADEAMTAGADGFVGKAGGMGELRAALREVAAGRRYRSDAARRPRLTLELAASAGEGDAVAALRPRQRQVLRFIGRGLTSAEIARQLGVSLKAVEYHRATLRRTLALRTRAALVRFAALYGFAARED